MLIKLSGRALRPISTTSDRPFIGRIATSVAAALDSGRGILLGDQEPPDGFRAYLSFDASDALARHRDAYVLDRDFSYLADGDVVRVDPVGGHLHALYRRDSRSNSLLVTERCDNYCVMCSQPPKDRDDSWIVDELLDAIPLMSPETREIGITGGEPGLLGDRLIEVIACLRDHLPRTAVHVLSNGRAFKRTAFACAVAEARHLDLMIGIPLYADVPEIHDYVVQARGAFDETVRGILNLKQHGVPVELRFVVHRDTYEGLPRFARFVTRNLLFVDHVAIMGLELMGFARTNLDAIWIDPVDYQRQLAEAVEILDRAGAPVSIYNHPLCVLDRSLHRFARASISDWKNAYLDECSRCSLRAACGGLFASSSLRRSRGIVPVVT